MPRSFGPVFAVGGIGALAVSLWWVAAARPLVPPATTVDATGHFLIATSLILVTCHGLGIAAGRLGQPRVIGEILGGIVLGPSAFGALLPSASAWVFAPAVAGSLQAVGQLGLAIFVFLSWTEARVRPGAYPPRVVGLVMVASMVPTFLAGTAVGWLLRHAVAGAGQRGGTAPVFIGLALSVTAVPVLARILTDLRIARTSWGSLALTAAIVGDGFVWATLAIVMALSGEGNTMQLLGRALGCCAAGCVTVFGVRPALATLLDGRHGRDVDDTRVLALLLAGAVSYAAVSQLLGLHPAVGAFLFGTAVPKQAALARRLSSHLRGFTMTLLLPVFFAQVGMSTSLGIFAVSLAAWGVTAALWITGVAGKIAGTALGARLGGVPDGDARKVAVLMNCRGVTELVIASIGLQYHLINQLGFTALVVVALTTTAITGPAVVRLSSRGTDLPPVPS